MPITRTDFLNAIIDDGITEINIAYQRPDQHDKKEGAIAGFEACRMKSDEELLMLRAKAEEDARKAMSENSPRYWWYRCFELQVEWTLNVLSAAMVMSDMEPLTSITARGMSKALNIMEVDKVRF